MVVLLLFVYSQLPRFLKHIFCFSYWPFLSFALLKNRKVSHWLIFALLSLEKKIQYIRQDAIIFGTWDFIDLGGKCIG